MTMKNMVIAACVLSSLTVAAGIRVEIDPASKDNRTVQIAADEFRKFYQKLTGREAKGDKRILLNVDQTKSADGYDAFSMKSDEKGVVLTGGNARSVLYAVYELLEKRGGCRWYWDGDKVPRIAELDISDLNVDTKSRFKYRATRYFAHRGLSRFRAQQWGPEEWRREIDYLAKIKVNVFMLRMGWHDLFQKAFPEVCDYPDPGVNLPGTGKGYDNHTLHWSLQFRGLLRKMIQDYGFERGMMQPEDFGTMTHWYTPTPKDFLDKVNPDFLPNSVAWYSDPSSLVWDIRDPKWMDMYWKLTEASIKHYGRSDILHTMGLSERKCSTNAAENLRLKIEVTKKLLDDAQRRHPESLIILGGWDFHFTWEPEECRQLFAELKDYKNLLLWDYSVDEAREGAASSPTRSASSSMRQVATTSAPTIRAFRRSGKSARTIRSARATSGGRRPSMLMRSGTSISPRTCGIRSTGSMISTPDSVETAMERRPRNWSRSGASSCRSRLAMAADIFP